MMSSDSFKPGSSKVYNIIKVIHYLRLHGDSTVMDISQNTAIPLATAYRIIHILLEDEFVLQTEKAPSANGRQPTLYSINSNYAYAVCIIIEKSDCSLCLSDLNGRSIQAYSFHIKSKWEKEEALEGIDRGIRSLKEARFDSDVFWDKVHAIHVAVEADVDISAGKIIHFSGADCFDGFDVVQYFQDRYQVPTRLNKLLFVEAVASMRNYCRYDFENYVYLHIGIGFGATIVINHKIYTGQNGKAGELVRLHTADGRTWEEAYNTSNLYQSLVQAAALNPNSQLNSIMMQSLSPSRNDSGNSLMVVLDRALEDNCADAINMVSEAAVGWAQAIRLLHAFFDPEVIVIGGDISANQPHVFNLLRTKLNEGNEFEGIILPAQYETSLMDAVAEDTLDMLYEKICDDYISSFVLMRRSI